MTKNVKFIIVLLLPLIAIVLAHFFTTYYHHPICIWKILFNHDCWGCGITRAFNALCHFDFITAWNYNPRIYIIVPLLTYIWVYELHKTIYKN